MEAYVKIGIHFIALAIVVLSTGCTTDQKSRSLEETATAYTSNSGETNSDPFLTAWGDTLKPGMKAIAVSRDLIKMGLSHNKEVRIDGLKGTYIVLDKMNKRWERKIDIYMGLDAEKARKWGKRKVKIYWKDDKS
jgi:3D (Asp-Asp-Asp) domain-containing protein